MTFTSLEPYYRERVVEVSKMVKFDLRIFAFHAKCNFCFSFFIFINSTLDVNLITENITRISRAILLEILLIYFSLIKKYHYRKELQCFGVTENEKFRNSSKIICLYVHLDSIDRY